MGFPTCWRSNGHVYPQVDSAQLGATYKEPRILYWNQGNGKFKDVSKSSGPGLTTPYSGRGLAIADLWNDGRLEAVVNNLSEVPLLLVNEAKNENHWLGLKLTGTMSNRSAIGSRVTVHGTKRAGWMRCAAGQAITAAAIFVFMWAWSGDEDQAIDVRWPNGESEEFSCEGVDRFVELVEGKGKPLH